jgi:hypothetical protein
MALLRCFINVYGYINELPLFQWDTGVSIMDQSRIFVSGRSIPDMILAVQL